MQFRPEGAVPYPGHRRRDIQKEAPSPHQGQRHHRSPGSIFSLLSNSGQEPVRRPQKAELREWQVATVPHPQPPTIPHPGLGSQLSLSKASPQVPPTAVLPPCS